MPTKTSTFALYRPFIDAYMKGHPDVAKVVRVYFSHLDNRGLLFLA